MEMEPVEKGSQRTGFKIWQISRSWNWLQSITCCLGKWILMVAMVKMRCMISWFASLLSVMFILSFYTLLSLSLLLLHQSFTPTLLLTCVPTITISFTLCVLVLRNDITLVEEYLLHLHFTLTSLFLAITLTYYWYPSLSASLNLNDSFTYYSHIFHSLILPITLSFSEHFLYFLSLTTNNPSSITVYFLSFFFHLYCH